MAISKAVYRWERIVPVRFARAPHATDATKGTGPTSGNAPDPDDRGFLPTAVGGPIIPVGLNPSVAADARPLTRVRLIREDIDNTADLYISAETAGIIDLVTPAAGTAPPQQKEMLITFRATAAGTTNLRVHFGNNGPVIYQGQVVVSRIIWVPVSVHAPRITGTVQTDTAGAVVPETATRAGGSAAAFLTAARQYFTDANKVFFPYGIQFWVDPAVDYATPIALTNQGMVDDLTAEFGRVMALNRRAKTINVYFVPQIAGPTNAANPTPADNVLGSTIGFRRSPATFGLVLADGALPSALAHELGHILGLINSATWIHSNAVNDAAFPGTGREVRSDIVTRRRLMYAYAQISVTGSRPYRNDVGYGSGRAGAMLTVKQLNNDSTDDEMADVRRYAARVQK